jgi:crotonobetainyl-CoA:carnitine CoA-transferase CaiB-like acyl-CoA transferase
VYQLLNGTKVLEFSNYWPDATGQYFADLGAEVIRVEPPEVGSLTRYMPWHGGLQLDLMHWERGKKSLAIDLKSPQGRDVSLESFGVDYEVASKVNPAIVYISISGWGQTGPYRRLPCHGMGFDAFSGFRQPTYGADGLPEIPRELPEMAACLGTLYAAMGGLAAYTQRLKTGKGAHIDVSEGEAGAHYFYREIDRLLNPGEEQPRPDVASRYQYYATKDGKVIAFFPIEQKFWKNFCQAVNRPDLAGVGNWETGMDNGSEAERRELVPLFRTKTRAEWIEFFIQHNIPSAPENTIDELLEDPHFKARNPFVEYPHPEKGNVRMLGTPIKVNGETMSGKPAPELGQHTDEVLGAFAIAPERIAELRAGGVIR